MMYVCMYALYIVCMNIYTTVCRYVHICGKMRVYFLKIVLVFVVCMYLYLSDLFLLNFLGLRHEPQLLATQPSPRVRLLLLE